MSSIKIMTAAEIRMELARRRMTRTELAATLGLSRDYVGKILRELRGAEARRAQITDYFKKNNQNNDMRGIS